MGQPYGEIQHQGLLATFLFGLLHVINCMLLIYVLHVVQPCQTVSSLYGTLNMTFFNMARQQVRSISLVSRADLQQETFPVSLQIPQPIGFLSNQEATAAGTCDVWRFDLSRKDIG